MSIPSRSAEAGTYFVTSGTFNRRRLFQVATNAALFLETLQHYRRAGNYKLHAFVVMPDHIHLFVSGDADFVLSKWVAGLKRAISKAVGSRGESWQPTFFDHILRSDESYSEKWEYVYENPVRAGLVKVSDEWKYQGEVVLIDRV